MKKLFMTLLLALAGATAALAQADKPPPRPGFAEITWDDLVPADWDPLQQFKGMNFGALGDADPRAQQMLTKMREVWDNAPVNAKMDGRKVRLPGYVVPLEENTAGLTEFLLVPYFGACIHTPPPPANQIVLVQPAKPIQGYHTMDTVWASGRLRAARQGSPMGTSAYRLEAALVERYQAPPQR